MSQQQFERFTSQDLAPVTSYNGAPGMSLSIQEKDPRMSVRSGGLARPQSQTFKKGHHVVQKDVYRTMKADKTIAKDLQKKKAGEFGRCPKRSQLNVANSQYKTMTDVIIDQFQRAEIPEDQLYMIDKVVRMRGQHGRFGIDHSELLNYELHQTNKERDDHMNWLVYKRVPPSEYDMIGNNASSSTLADSSPDLNDAMAAELKVSAILFNKLNPKKVEMKEDSVQTISSESQSSHRREDPRASYQDWLKRKDAEKRLKRKLIRQSQNQVRADLLEIAKTEKSKFEERVKAMEQWLRRKQLDEANRVALLRDIQAKGDNEREMRKESKIKSFADWQRRQGHMHNQHAQNQQRQQRRVQEDRVNEQVHHQQQQMMAEQRYHQQQQYEDEMEEDEEGEMVDHGEDMVEEEEDPMDLEDMEMGGIEMDYDQMGEEYSQEEVEDDGQRFRQPLRQKDNGRQF